MSFISVIVLLSISSIGQIWSAPVPNQTDQSVTVRPQVIGDSSIMNIWNYKIERQVKASVNYKIWDLGVWEEGGADPNNPGDRRYYVTPPVTFISGSGHCNFMPVTRSYDVVYNVQLWERELPRAVVEKLKTIGVNNVREDQVHPLPFYQARVVWNSAEQKLYDLKLSTAWINNLQQQQEYTFHVAAENNASCQLLAETLSDHPHHFIDFIQLQFTVSAAKIDSKVLTIKSSHIVSSQLVSSLKNLPGAENQTRFLSSNDYNRMLLQISNQVVASETISGDYIDVDDELSLKDAVGSMLNAQKENSANFDDRMWSSTFWDPTNARPDQVTKELNKYFKLNQTDNRFYLTQSDSSSTSASVNAVIKMVPVGASGSHTSSSSMTSDQMSHLLEQYNIESEIQGDKFVAKKLDLMRLNLNDLTRQDLISSKRVRVRQVEIGGVLQVAVGNSTFGQMADENRYLRQQNTDYERRLQAFNSTITDDRKAAQNGQASLKASLDNHMKEFTVIANRLRAVQSGASDSCTTHTTHEMDAASDTVLRVPDHWIGGYSEMVNDVRCGAGKVLTRWQPAMKIVVIWDPKAVTSEEACSRWLADGYKGEDCVNRWKSYIEFTCCSLA